MGPETLRIGLVSPRVAATRADALATVDRFLAEAAARGAAVVCFPETYLPGYRGLDFTPHAARAALLDRQLAARDGGGHACVVEAAVLAQPVDGAVDVVRSESAPGKALPELGFGELAAGELLERGQIGGLSQTS